MPRIHITEKNVAQIPTPPSGRGTVFYHDSKMSGFQIGKGRRTTTFYAFTTRHGRGYRMRLGYWPAMSCQEARNLATRVIADFRLGNDPRRTDERRTLKEVFESATDERLADGRISKKTAAHYRYLFDTYLNRLANKPIDEVTEDDARNLKKRLPAYSFNLVKRVVDASFTTLNLQSPFKGVRANRETARESNISSYGDWYRYVRNIESPHTRRCLLILALTGMRKSNACALRWDEIDFASNAIILAKTKTGRNVRLPMGKLVTRLLTAQRELKIQSPWVFPSYVGKGKHITELRLGQQGRVHDLRRQFTSACNKAKLFGAAVKKMRGDKLSAVDEAYFTDDAPLRWADEVADIICQDWGVDPQDVV